MRRSQFSARQLLAILEDVDAGMPVAEVIRKAGISRATLFTWRAKYNEVPRSTTARRSPSSSS